jgi:hypothetical protein
MTAHILGHGPQANKDALKTLKDLREAIASEIAQFERL